MAPQITNMRIQLFISLLFTTAAFAQHPTQKLNGVFNPANKKVLVTAHRGDWRNTPENSIQALNNCVVMGVDIVEIDLKKTKDGQLINMHDKTIDRTTTGKGHPEDYTLQEIKQFRLRAGTAHPTSHQVPTFREVMLAAKNKVIIDVDKGYDYFPQVVKELEETGTMGQAIVNVKDNATLEELEKEQGVIPDSLTIMVVVKMDKPAADSIINSYVRHRRTIIQCIFSKDTLPVLSKLKEYRKHYGVWVNSLWPEQNGGHDDDKAVEEGKPDETWGWLISKGANMIQTDRPQQLVDYIKKRGSLK